MARIHPTAIVDAGAELADDVEIGPYSIVESDVTLGAGTVLRPHAIVRRYATLGEGNYVDSQCVLGGPPQDLKFSPDTVSYLRIGDRNTFRESVTISRATGEGAETRVGSDTYWMANSHAGHNVTVGDGAILVNESLLAGFATPGRRAILAGGAMVHQFCWVGELTMVQGLTPVTKHVPPFVLMANMRYVASLNVVGLRRCEYLTDPDRRQIKELFRLFYRSGIAPAEALAEMDGRDDLGGPAGRFIEFVRRVLDAEAPFARGLCPGRPRSKDR